jgi:hypothetical protein
MQMIGWGLDGCLIESCIEILVLEIVGKKQRLGFKFKPLTIVWSYKESCMVFSYGLNIKDCVMVSPLKFLVLCVLI